MKVIFNCMVSPSSIPGTRALARSCAFPASRHLAGSTTLTDATTIPLQRPVCDIVELVGDMDDTVADAQVFHDVVFTIIPSEDLWPYEANGVSIIAH